jgi:hypothetical protein
MAAVKCGKCEAVVTVTILDGESSFSQGDAFRTKCKELRDPSAAATECTSMQTAITRAISRLSARSVVPART